MRRERDGGGFAWWAHHDRARRQGFALVGFAAAVGAVYLTAVPAVVLAVLWAADDTRAQAADAARLLAALAAVTVATLTAGLALAASKRTPAAALARTAARDPAPGEADAVRWTLSTFAIGLGIPAPRLQVVADSAPNAFVVGRPSAGTVVLTEGALRLPGPELDALCAHSASRLSNPDVAVLAAGASLLVWAARAAQLVLLLPVLVLLSALVGVPPSYAAAIALAILAVEIVTWPLLFAADRAAIALLDRAGSLADLEAVRLTHAPEGLARLLIYFLENRTRVRSPWHVAHLWFERDGAWTDGLPHGSWLTGFVEPPRIVHRYRPTSQRPLAERAAVVVDLAGGDATLRDRLARAAHS